MAVPKLLKGVEKCWLYCGFDDGLPAPPVVLDIAPTMKNITHGGRTYFRMPDCGPRSLDDGTKAAFYLWDGYGEELMRRGDAGLNTRA